MLCCNEWQFCLLITTRTTCLHCGLTQSITMHQADPTQMAHHNDYRGQEICGCPLDLQQSTLDCRHQAACDLNIAFKGFYFCSGAICSTCHSGANTEHRPKTRRRTTLSGPLRAVWHSKPQVACASVAILPRWRLVTPPAPTVCRWKESGNTVVTAQRCPSTTSDAAPCVTQQV
jgi:hypothetical protein